MRRKLSALVALAAVAAVAVCAQTQQPAAPRPEDSGGVAVVKFSWDKERVNWERDPFGGHCKSMLKIRFLRP